jgi:hypothetical protein|tara:strand:- start:527 stop:775 length:249 start_codon:yes stop_codon:yes gene_type:complete
MKNLLTASIFLTTLIVITSFAPRDANAGCYRTAYGNVECDGQTDAYGRQNSGSIPGKVGNLNTTGNVGNLCGYDYMGRYNCN